MVGKNFYKKEERWSKFPTFTVPILSKKSFQRPHPEYISTDPLHYHYLYVLLGNIRIRYLFCREPLPSNFSFYISEILIHVKIQNKGGYINGTVRPD
jgi:hypothetical protein